MRNMNMGSEIAFRIKKTSSEYYEQLWILNPKIGSVSRFL